MNAPFERVVLLETSGAKHLVNLDRETVKIPSVGVVRADTLQGLLGRRWTIGDRTFLVMVPSIRDEIESVRREAQIIGTKDAPALLWNCDVKPGDFVLEIGAGSGALTLALAHAVGSKGRVVTYDIRPEFLDRARDNVTAADLEGVVEFKIGDGRKGVVERGADAMILDIPDPWEAVDGAATVLRPCGHFASYSPNMEQVNRTVATLRKSTFVEIRSVEIIEREILAATITLLVFAFVGNYIFFVFGTSIPAFRIAGGILLFTIAFSMMQGERSRTQLTAQDRAEALEREAAGIVPLGIPMMAGPGAITTVMVLMAEASFPTFDMGQIAVIVGSILATMGITWVLLYQADRVFSRIGRMGAYAISRIIGLILAAIAVQFVILGIQGAIVSYFR